MKKSAVFVMHLSHHRSIRFHIDFSFSMMRGADSSEQIQAKTTRHSFNIFACSPLEGSVNHIDSL